MPTGYCARKIVNKKVENKLATYNSYKSTKTYSLAYVCECVGENGLLLF